MLISHVDMIINPNKQKKKSEISACAIMYNKPATCNAQPKHFHTCVVSMLLAHTFTVLQGTQLFWLMSCVKDKLS